MPGVKGKSGRKTLRQEVAKDKELQKLWALARQSFSNKVQSEDLFQLAVFKKYFPDGIEMVTPKQNDAIEQLTKQVKDMINAHRRPKVNLP